MDNTLTMPTTELRESEHASGGGGRRQLWRSRWAAIGAAVAVTLGGGGMFAVQAASSVPSSVVTIDPVRILDTRDPVNIGLPGPFVSAVSQKLQVTGAAVPAGATGVLLNVTAVAPSADGFLSVRPGDATGVPTTSSLNFTAGDIVPNSVQVGLPTTGANAGQIDITYDAYGVAGPTTEVLIDVVGYTIAGGAGTGPAGPTGATGPRGFSAWDPIPSGQTVTGSMIWDEAVIADNSRLSNQCSAARQGQPGPVEFVVRQLRSGCHAPTTDDDATCTGTVVLPTAPAGKVCIYLSGSNRVDNMDGRPNFVDGADGFFVSADSNGTPGLDMNVSFAWAYTAP